MSEVVWDELEGVRSDCTGGILLSEIFLWGNLVNIVRSGFLGEVGVLYFYVKIVNWLKN